MLGWEGYVGSAGLFGCMAIKGMQERSQRNSCAHRRPRPLHGNESMNPIFDVAPTVFMAHAHSAFAGGPQSTFGIRDLR